MTAVLTQEKKIKSRWGFPFKLMLEHEDRKLIIKNVREANAFFIKV